MRIVLTNVGKEEISKDYNSYNNQSNNTIINTEADIPEINPPYNRRKYNLNRNPFIPKSKSSYKYQALITDNNGNDDKYYQNKNKLVRAGLNSINKNMIPRQNLLSNEYYKINNSQNKESPMKIISLNHSVFTLPIEAKQLFNNNQFKDKNEINEIKKINKNNDEDNSFTNSRNISLPKIKNGISLKNILNSKNKKNIDHRLLQKEINQTDTNLINYLKSDKYIQPSFVKRINNSNDKGLFKLDKICQKYFQNEKEGIILRNRLQKKIKKEFSKDAQYCENGLKDMSNALKEIECIYKGFENTKGSKNFNLRRLKK
jgi:hypothetical protein